MKTPHNLTPEEIKGVIKYLIAIEHIIDENVLSDIKVIRVSDTIIQCRIYYVFEIKNEEPIVTDASFLIYNDFTMEEMQQKIDMVLNHLDAVML